MSPWQEWKQRNVEAQRQGNVSPAALLNPDSPKTPSHVQAERLAICEGCDRLAITKQCKECGCFMPSKTGLALASCPLGKWYSFDTASQE